MIYVIDDDEIMRECIKRACGKRKVREFSDVLAAMAAIADDELPEMIIMDVMLVGPDGFTFLNELLSYDDAAKIPVVIVSAVDFNGRDLSVYGVVATLLKDTFLPEEIKELVERYAG